MVLWIDRKWLVSASSNVNVLYFYLIKRLSYLIYVSIIYANCFQTIYEALDIF